MYYSQDCEDQMNWSTLKSINVMKMQIIMKDINH